MDPRLEALDKLLASIDREDLTELNVARAILGIDLNDPATMRWAAAILAARAAELEED